MALIHMLVAMRSTTFQQNNNGNEKLKIAFHRKSVGKCKKKRETKT